MIKEMVCIVCPMSCHLSVEMERKTVKSVTGNACPRGEKYAHEEMIRPMRVLTSTVLIKNAEGSRLPVVTSEAIPKSKMKDVMKQINRVKVKAPIHLNDVIIENVARTGVNIIASRSMNSIK